MVVTKIAKIKKTGKSENSAKPKDLEKDEKSKQEKKPKTILQTPTGMSDILPQDQPYFDKILKISESFSNFYGFEKISTPILEFAELFEKGTGIDTDIVEKEMYTLRTKGGDLLALRPEFTPPLVRAYIEHGMMSLPQPVKLFSAGPVFRYGRPQAGRYRQFHQFNIETFGSKRPVVDIETIYLCYNILYSLGIKDALVKINSIGCRDCRPCSKKHLINYLKKKQNFLCPDCKTRLKNNPLRVLDCKKESCEQIARGAPQLLDHLCKACHSHFKRVLEFLDELKIPYLLDSCLVRGLDYYTRTVFEIVAENEKSVSQNALIGGGRYDDLIKLFSKKDIPGCGAAGGIERIINLLKEREVKVLQTGKPEVFFAQLGDSAKIRALKLLEEFRKNNFLVAHSLSRDSLSKQLNLANRLKVKYSLILGEEEVKRDSIILRDMKTGKQSLIKISNIVKEIKNKLK
ncbi:histidine--tRNA ligase [Patescibacteria group bacterium]|nr:histidine--tRNA ligase [Patescibacteria group bacterium]MBU4022923.1 histidine--tRNA ligase [Patescibacteria group bacterium]MBU4078303.1 histidine--tRNA ligase [Patescibacteria group bacterium]